MIGQGRIGKDRRAVAALEFAVAAPLFLLAVFMIVQTGLQLFVQMTLDYGVGAAARQVQIGTIRDANGNALSAFRAVMCRYTVVLSGSCASAVQLYAVSGAAFAALPPATAVNGTLVPNTFSVGTSGSAVLIQAGYNMPYLISWLVGPTRSAAAMLLSTTAMQNEPY